MKKLIQIAAAVVITIDLLFMLRRPHQGANSPAAETAASNASGLVVGCLFTLHKKKKKNRLKKKTKQKK
jgi:hypothetical protein